MKPDKRSPIKYKPLRNPGQSLERQRDDLLYDKVLAPLIIAVMMVWLVGMEWWYYFNPRTRNPLVLTIMASIAVGYCALVIWRAMPKLKRLRQGIEGEKAVGQFLERLRENGYQVFHDLIGDDFNVDHVIVGPAGVFTIETKTLSKPVRGDVKIQYDGEAILVNGQAMERNPVRQAKAQANWIRNVLLETSAREYRVRPVVLFPGWYVEQQPGSMRELWVLEPKALPKFLANEPAILGGEEIKLASGHLSRFIRAQEKDA